MFSWTRKPSSSSGRRAAPANDSSMDSGSRGRSPRLERRNAAKHIDYDAAGASGTAPASVSASASWSSSSSAERSPGLRPSRSLDLPPGSGTDFRISGSAEGEVDELCRSLGLSGPEEFAIPLAAWEARKARSNSDLLPRSRLIGPPDDSVARSISAPAPEQSSIALSVSAPIPEESLASAGTSANTNLVDESKVEQVVPQPVPESVSQEDVKAAPVGNVEGKDSYLSPRRGGGDGGIRGVRPPVLSPPPPIAALSPPVAVLAPPPARRTFVPDDRGGSAWDIVQSFAPREDAGDLGVVQEQAKSSDSEEDCRRNDEEGAAEGEEELRGLRIGETFEGFTGTSSLSNDDDDASSTTTETLFIISPNGKFKRKIKSWMRGALLGHGSFGMVYEGISDEGAFFAVKEVSLLDQGSNAQQCILALEQEIALLSQFEHENIVQYYGTDKEESKLYIFLELVTQGSLASLYQKYRLRDSQVSAYTRQILNGLVYLHERNVVHRDIKCANILVHANGSVKLADFGLAKEMSKISMLKSCKGSVYWMAPEVVHPRKTYGLPADIWSLGCTVLEMLTRQIPYPNVEWANAFFMIGKGEQPPIPSYLSKEAQDFVSQCVRVDPEERPSALLLLEHPFVNRPLRASSLDSSSSPIIST